MAPGSRTRLQIHRHSRRPGSLRDPRRGRWVGMSVHRSAPRQYNHPRRRRTYPACTGFRRHRRRPCLPYRAHRRIDRHPCKHLRLNTVHLCEGCEGSQRHPRRCRSCRGHCRRMRGQARCTALLGRRPVDCRDRPPHIPRHFVDASWRSFLSLGCTRPRRNQLGPRRLGRSRRVSCRVNIDRIRRIGADLGKGHSSRFGGQRSHRPQHMDTRLRSLRRCPHCSGRRWCRGCRHHTRFRSGHLG
jgi:hypothetical protein